MKKKALIALAMVACMLLGVAGTYAYLTSTPDPVVNTFTAGAVNIDINETSISTGEDTKANTYKVYPGGTYDKDPTITVEEGSEECYVGAVVTVADWSNWAAMYGGEDAEFADLHTGLGAGWSKVKENDGTIVFVYGSAVDPTSEIPAIFSAITIPDSADAGQLAQINQDTITVTAYAIQTNGMGGDARAALAEQWPIFAVAE